MQNLNGDIERLRILFKQHKPIIIIGGVAGSGKTTIGNYLLYNLDLDHSIGTGWIREIAASKTNKEKDPELFSHSFRPVGKNITPFEQFKASAMAVLPSVEACILRARREGQSLLIEGPMLIPGILKEGMYDLFIYLKKSDSPDLHYKMLTTGTHTKRQIFYSDLEPNNEIERELIAICKNHNILIVPFTNIEERRNMIIKEIALRFIK